MSFHVFLSHSSADKPAVEELARRLAKEGIQGWLDKWHLIAGAPWQPAIEKALAESETCAVFVGPSGVGPWQNEEMRAAIDQRVRESARCFRVIPVLLPGAERAERSSLPTFLAATTWVEFRDLLDDADAFHRLVCGIRGVEPGPSPGQAIYEGQCPYRGLRAFDVEDAPFFFGREALVQWLLNEVRPATEGQPVNRFLAILGASGSGKSSVARAGLVLALKYDGIAGSSRWPVAILRPGPDPVESLAVALSRAVNVGQGASALADLIAELQRSEKALHLVARQSLPENAPDMRVVVLVDQFEEVFTLCDKEELREMLVRNLLYAAKVVQGQTLVILTMRADFYAKCAANAGLAAALSDHHCLVGPMTEDELRRAIERPMQLVGCELEAGLVGLLLQDVRRQPGALPQLQHALLELWYEREGRRLTVKAYEKIGKLEGALQKRADTTVENLSEEEQELCRRTFLRLTQPGEGTEDTKRRASMQELLSLCGTSSAEEAIIQKLADASLLTTEGDLTHQDAFVEVAHEALIRNWPQLRKWIDADRAGLRTRTRLTEAAREWKNAARDPGYLYTGARLAVAKEWEASHPAELNADEDEFLSCSLHAQQQREAAKLEAARKLAEEQKRRAELSEQREKEQKEAAEKLRQAAKKLRRHAMAAAGAATAALILFAVSVFMWLRAQEQARIASIQRAAAEEQARIATIQRLAAQSSEKKANNARDQADGLINFLLHESLGYEKIGDVLQSQGKLPEALDVYQQYLTIAKRLVDQDNSNSNWQRELGVSYNKVGEVLQSQGKLPEALDVHQQSLTIAKRLVDQDNSNSGWQRDLAVSYDKVGEVLQAQGKLPEALDVYEKCLTIAKRLVDQDNSNSSWQRDLAVSYEKVGEVLRAQGKVADALDVYEKCLTIAKRLVDQDNSNSGWQRDLAVSYNHVGKVLQDQGKLPEALDVYQQSLTIAKRLVDQDNSNSGWQRDLAWSYREIGEILRAQGKLPEALDAYQQSLNIRRTLADQDRSNSGWQWDLSTIYEEVGNVLSAEGDISGALKSYRDYLAIAEKLANQDPSNAGWQNAAAWSRYCVAKVLIQAKDSNGNEARRLVVEGIDIMKRLERQGALDPNAQDTLNKLNELEPSLPSS
jgi:tetratricopeptide (TPR) repeat protein